MVVALLGVLKAGGGLRAARPRVPERAPRLHAGGRGHRAAAHRAALVAAAAGGALRGGVARRGARRLRSWRARRTRAYRSRPDNLAYVIYTSGSTGQAQRRAGHAPRRSLELPRLDAAQRRGCARATCCWPSPVSLRHRGAGAVSAAGGGRRVWSLAGAAETRDPALLARRLRVCGATLMQATPATWRLLLEAGLGRRAGGSRRCAAARRCGASWRSGSACAVRRGLEPLRADRDDRLVVCREGQGRRGCDDRTAGRRHAASTCWTGAWSRRRWAWPGSCTSGAREWRAATSGAPT